MDIREQAMKALVAINANVGDLANSAVQVEVQHAINALALDLRTLPEVQTEPEPCSTCGGSPHPSGGVCVCGGVGTMLAEVAGLRKALYAARQPESEAGYVVLAYRGDKMVCLHLPSDDYGGWLWTEQEARDFAMLMDASKITGVRHSVARVVPVTEDQVEGSVSSLATRRQDGRGDNPGGGTAPDKAEAPGPSVTAGGSEEATGPSVEADWISTTKVCTRRTCASAPLEPVHGFYVCPKCHYSYGKRPHPDLPDLTPPPASVEATPPEEDEEGLIARIRREYAEMPDSEWFKKVYVGKPLGDFVQIEDAGPSVPGDAERESDVRPSLRNVLEILERDVMPDEIADEVEWYTWKALAACGEVDAHDVLTRFRAPTPEETPDTDGALQILCRVFDDWEAIWEEWRESGETGSANLGRFIRRHLEDRAAPEGGENEVETPEQAARDILDRMDVDGAQSMSAGDVVEIANLIADNRHFRSLFRGTKP